MPIDGTLFISAPLLRFPACAGTSLDICYADSALMRRFFDAAVAAMRERTWRRMFCFDNHCYARVITITVITR